MTLESFSFNKVWSLPSWSAIQVPLYRSVQNRRYARNNLKAEVLGFAAWTAGTREDGQPLRLMIGGEHRIEGNEILFVQLPPVGEIFIQRIATLLRRGLNGVCRAHVGALRAKNEPAQVAVYRAKSWGDLRPVVDGVDFLLQGGQGVRCWLRRRLRQRVCPLG
jgi:hypothetical protein